MHRSEDPIRLRKEGLPVAWATWKADVRSCGAALTHTTGSPCGIVLW
jgi:hypothetical protein